MITKNSSKEIENLSSSIENLYKGIRSNDRTSLACAITLLESQLPEDRQKAQLLLKKCLLHSGNSIRIAVTGSPGVGKSTFIDVLGSYLTSLEKTVAVLAIDPSSQYNKGSILGDKTRMEKLASSSKAFIRPTPAAGTLGGISRRTRESIILCEAAGYEHIFIETVGVGQSEISVRSMVDFFLLLVMPGSGDELQAMKKGIMEVADAIIIHKADGEYLDAAKRAKASLKEALHLFPPTENGWKKEVWLCSSLNNSGIEETWNVIEDFWKKGVESGFFHNKRKEQNKRCLHDEITAALIEKFYTNETVKKKMKEFEKQFADEKLSPYDAVDKLLNDYFGNK